MENGESGFFEAWEETTQSLQTRKKMTVKLFGIVAAKGDGEVEMEVEHPL